MWIPEKYTHSLLTTENVIHFLSHYKNNIDQWSDPIFWVDYYKASESKKLSNFINETQEYNVLKEKLFGGLHNIVNKIEKDKNSIWASASDLIELRNLILSISNEIEQISWKFQWITKIYLSNPYYPNEMINTIHDFIKVETELFIAIKDEFYSAIHNWMKIHESELIAIYNTIETHDNDNDNSNVVLWLQKKRLESYISNIQNTIIQ